MFSDHLPCVVISTSSQISASELIIWPYHFYRPYGKLKKNTTYYWPQVFLDLLATIIKKKSIEPRKRNKKATKQTNKTWQQSAPLITKIRAFSGQLKKFAMNKCDRSLQRPYSQCRDINVNAGSPMETCHNDLLCLKTKQLPQKTWPWLNKRILPPRLEFTPPPAWNLCSPPCPQW